MSMSLDYPITRSFTWRRFTPISLAVAVIVIAILSVINTALTGYETITVFQSDPHAVQPLWFDSIMPFYKAKPGSLCENHLFNVGDPLTTNYSFFPWTIDSIIKPNAGNSGLSYGGTPLTSCDVTSVYLAGSLLTWSMDFTILVSCVDPDNSFNVTARTSFSTGLLPGRYSSLAGLIRILSDGTEDVRGAILGHLISDGANDLGFRAYNALLYSNYSSTISISAQAKFKNFCPLSLGLNASCAINPPQFNIPVAAIVFPNTTVRAYSNQTPVDPIWNPWVFDNDTELPLYNVIQAVYAAIRMDLGNPSLNNFILHPAALNGTITSTFPLTPANGEAFSNSSMYQDFISPPPFFKNHMPVTVPGPAVIQLVYPCRSQQRKSPGQLVISVLVATLSMFSTGWAVFMTMAIAIAKRNNPNANRCEGHCFRHRHDIEPSCFDTSETYDLQRRGPTRKVSGARGAVYQRVGRSPSSSTWKPEDLPTEIDSTSERLMIVNARPDISDTEINSVSVSTPNVNAPLDFHTKANNTSGPLLDINAPSNS